MLVGDRWGSERAASPAVPFAPFPNTCGHYLMRALPDTWWHECAIVNAYTRDSQDEEWRPQPLGAINAALGSPPIIALGWAAASALANMGLDSAHVFHPQYWKRFYFHDISAYTIPLQLAREDAESG